MAREGGGASLAPQVAPGEHYDDSSSSREKRPTGRVVGIIRRNWRTRGYSGSLQPDRLGRPAKQSLSNVLFCPVERRYPFIRIQTRQVCLCDCPCCIQGSEQEHALAERNHYLACCIRVRHETLARASSSLLGLPLLFCHWKVRHGTGLHRLSPMELV